MIPIASTKLGDEEIEAVVGVLRSGHLRQGEKCKEFEENFREAVGARYATTMANGTVALHAAYSNLINPGDEVIVPAFTFFATASMVCYAGGKPVFCDIDPRTFTIDLNDMETKITDKTKAIAPVHLFGNSCDIDGITEIAKKHGLKIIWDAAQAHMTKYKRRDVGSFGEAVCYSFYATKNMTTGEGGMIVSDNEELIDRCILMKQQGQSAKYVHTYLGTNYRMTDIEAAIGLAQLEKLPEYTKKRRQNAAFLIEKLKDVGGILLPWIESFVEHSYHQFTILLELEKLSISREQFVQKLNHAEIGAAVNYPTPLNRQPIFQGLLGEQHMPNAERVAERCLSLPIHPFLTQKDLETISSKIINLTEHYSVKV